MSSKKFQKGDLVKQKSKDSPIMTVEDYYVGIITNKTDGGQQTIHTPKVICSWKEQECFSENTLELVEIEKGGKI